VNGAHFDPQHPFRQILRHIIYTIRKKKQHLIYTKIVFLIKKDICTKMLSDQTIVFD